MSSAEARDASKDSSAGSRSDIALFPPTPADVALGDGRAETTLARPLVPLAVAFAVGIALASAVAIDSRGWTGGALLTLGGGILALWLRAPALRWPLLATAFVCLGAQTATVAMR